MVFNRLCSRCNYILMTLAYKGFIFNSTNILVDQINWKLSNPQKAILLNIFKLNQIVSLNDLLVFCLSKQINKPFKHYGNDNKLFGKIQKREIKNCLLKFYPNEKDKLKDVFEKPIHRTNLIDY